MYTSYNDLLTILLTLREGDKCPTGTDGDAAARPKLSGLSPASWLPATGVDVSEFNSLLSDTILLFSNWRPGCWLNRSWLDIDSVVDSCLVTERGDISCPSGVGFTAGARGEFCSPCIDWFVPESNASLILEIDDCFVNCCWLWLLYGVCGDIGPKDCWFVCVKPCWPGLCICCWPEAWDCVREELLVGMGGWPGVEGPPGG